MFDPKLPGRRWLLAAAMLLAIRRAGAADGALPTADPLRRPALRAAGAARGVLLAVAVAGNRLVAAGERGLIVWSDDGARTWRQAAVPVSVTLTALSFPLPTHGWAVGHGGVVLHTRDAGQTWVRQLDGASAAQLELAAARGAGDAKRLVGAQRLVDDGPDKPFLAVHFWTPRRGLAVGAYGLTFGTEDGGATWQSWMGRIPNPQGLHLNALYVTGSAVFLAGEQGLLVRSRDDAQTFEALQSPYRGSWFAVAGWGNHLVVGGLRGNVYWSPDLGATWTRSAVSVPITVSASITTGEQRMVFVNQAGMLLTSDDAGRSLQPAPRPPGAPLTALARMADGRLFAASFGGIVGLPAAAPRSQ